jgi:hypothetical protein
MTRDAVARAIRTLGERDGKTAGQIQADMDAEWDRQKSGWLHGAQNAKFYYAHLSEGQMDVFVELVNAGHMKIGVPGYLYVLPFFIRSSAQAG